MCGICGAVGVADERLMERMASTMRHRGPDGDGVRCFAADGGRPPASLGHRRLSIIDPTPRATQPMAYGEGQRYWITYNGELYNFRELRRELEADGFAFRTECDTEVMLAMYARHGEKMLDRVNGIFAFAIWDSATGELFMARDRLGVKPLYHAHHDGTLFFASEAKALLPALPPPALRTDAVDEFLTFLWVPEPETLFEGISKLPAGHCARYRDGHLRIRRYWDITFAPDDRGQAAWEADVRASVHSSVLRQMVADVPLGSFLSGGIDSSAIVANMAAAQNGRVTTFSIGFREDDLAHEIVPDDLRYARIVGRTFDVDYHELTLEANVVDLLPRLVWHMDEPVADPACITTYLICKAARERLTVILSGMGGDEIFAGYPRHLAARLGRIADAVPAAARRELKRAVIGRLTLGAPGRLRGPRRNLLKLLRGIDESPSERYLTYCSYYRADELTAVLSPELRHSLAGKDPFDQHRDHLTRVSDHHWLNQLLYLDLKTFLPCLNLSYTDKMSMAASTEVRVPLLDDELVALSARIPPRLKLRGLTRKYIFKRSMVPLLPRDVIWRPKAGFGAPIRSWLVGELEPMVDELLSPSIVKERGLLDPHEVRRIIAANAAGTEDNAARIWAMMTLELWQREFIDGEARRPAASNRMGERR